MKKIIIALVALATVISSCVDTKDSDVVYYTTSAFYYKIPKDLFKFADVKVCAIYPNLTGTKDMSEEHNIFRDTVVVVTSFDEISYGYHIYAEAKAVDSIAKQDSYLLDYEVGNQFGEMLYTGAFENIGNEEARGTDRYTYDELVKDLNNIVKDFNEKNQYYYNWLKTGDQKYSVKKIK